MEDWLANYSSSKAKASTWKRMTSLFKKKR